MQTATNQAKANTPAVPPIMRQQIGSIVYEVEVYFNPNAKEGMNDKIFRLIKREMEGAA